MDNSLKISVIGDSHSRVFSNTNIFTPFFIGPGSKFNLIQNPKGIKSRVKNILKQIHKEFDYNMLIIGEPSCRYQVNNDHYIYQKDFKNFNVINEKYLKQIYDSYTDIIMDNKEYNLIICAPISVYKQSISFSKKFSDMIGEFCIGHNILYFDVKNYIVDVNNDVNDDLKSDPIHSSQNILPFINQCFTDINIDVKIETNKSESFDKIKNKFKYNKKFNCYVY